VNIKVDKYSKLITDELTINKLSKYGWDSTGTLSVGHFRSFYLSTINSGRLHEYENEHPFENIGLYLKSWVDERHCLVKIGSGVNTAINLRVSTGRQDGNLVRWEPATNSSYVRLESSLDNQTWQTVAEVVPNTLSVVGYLDTNSVRGQLTYYRVVSLGNMGSETISISESGWRLGYPSKIESISASAGSHLDRIVISWDDSGVSNLYNKTESFDILRSKTNDFSSFSNYVKIASGLTSSPYTDLGEVGEPLSIDERYYYIVVANNNATSYLTASEYEQSKVWSNSAIGYISGFARGPVNFGELDETD